MLNFNIIINFTCFLEFLNVATRKFKITYEIYLIPLLDSTGLDPLTSPSCNIPVLCLTTVA